ncbi:uncharacterized protein [Primulina eburnea]|uniref:uncharacterized protein n=1 Tax=Primulina eburnea TaxID=1245227 RepID=UPI003C6C1E22
MQGAGPPQAHVYALTREQAEEAREEMIADEKERWTFYGKGSRPRVPLVSAIRMSLLLEHGHEGYLIYAVEVTEKKKEVGIEEIPIVAEFADVFPDEIPGFPPAREVEFGIELMPGTSPISRTPYRMAPSELRELKAQLQDLLDKGYIRPSVSPWGSTRCSICLEIAETTRNKIKAERRRPGGELRSLEVPTWKWEHISMDFVTHLPRSTGTIDAIWSSIPLVEFAYNNSYQSSIQMALFEALYGRRCRSPLYWDDVDRAAVTVRFGMKGKLAPRYVGPYEILQRIGTLAYRLALPPSLSGIHDVFHVSMLRKYEPDPSHVLDIFEVQLDPDVSYVERPVCILDRSERKLRSKLIPMVKVQWEHRCVEEATWETERHMRELYPYLF